MGLVLPYKKKRKKSAVEQFKRAKTLGEEINREDLREEDLAAPDTVIFEGHDSYDRHNASVTGTNVSEGGERSGRYRPLRSKCFLNRAIEDKEAMKAKILESASTAFSRTYTVVHYQSDIGQTSRALKSRTREHKRAVFTGDKNSLLAQHCAQTNHDFNFDDVEIVDRCSQWSRRLFLEAWHSIREPNSINEHVYIPEMYKILANPC